MKKASLFFALLMTLGLTGKALAQTDYSDTDIQSFVEVQPELQGIRNEYAGRLEGVTDPEAAADLQQEASTAMIDVIEAGGLDLDTYNTISTALQSDTELRDRVEELLMELGQG